MATKLIFLGTGTSHGVPMIGCDCEVCRSEDPRDRRNRSAVALVLADGRTILIDTPPELRLAAVACGLKRVDAILYTHSHFDHASHAARIRRLGAKVVANQDGAEALASGDDRCIGYAVERAFEPCDVDRVVSDGDELEIGGSRIRCIEAPGHANSCVVYEVVMDGRRLWFTGDVVLTGPECQSVELGWEGGPDYDRPTYLETLQRLRRMDCDCVFPGHGPPCIGNGKRLIEMAYTKAMTEWI